MKKLALFKVKDGKVKEWSNWCQELATTRKAEALASFGSENVLREMCALFLVDREYFVLGLSEAHPDFLPADPNLPVNQMHKKMKDQCLEKLGNGSVLYDLEH